jgi:hypothetical protein
VGLGVGLRVTRTDGLGVGGAADTGVEAELRVDGGAGTPAPEHAPTSPAASATAISDFIFPS